MTKTAFSNRSHQQASSLIHKLKLSLQVLFKLSIAAICVAQGGTFLFARAPVVTLVGIALMISGLRWFRFARRDFRSLNEARVVVTFQWYVQDSNRPVAA